jgi:4'-phosphopantetheinyl transferase
MNFRIEHELQNMILISRNDIHLWIASVESFNGYLKYFLEILTFDELERANRFLTENAFKQFTITHGLLRTILSNYLQTEPEKIEFVYNQFGKPSLVTKSESGFLCFNMSHTSGRVMYAFAQDREIGIDIELVRPIFGINHIIKRFMSLKEKSQYLSLSEDQKTKAFFKWWTCKEAYCKAVGVGLSDSLMAFSTSLLMNQQLLPEVILTIENNSNIRSYKFVSISAPDYVATIVTKGDIGKIIHLIYQP